MAPLIVLAGLLGSMAAFCIKRPEPPSQWRWLLHISNGLWIAYSLFFFTFYLIGLPAQE